MDLRDLLMVVNPRLANYLESHNSDDMYFCFRWVLVVFKREFCFDDIMRLWEHVNDLSMHIDLNETLTTAEAIFHQLAASQDKLPIHVCKILSLGDSSDSSEG
ncbi:unnamed protein product [Onchocerca flexuosa]|nr:unnamed protein product [Onchocerca flexuosa]